MGSQMQSGQVSKASLWTGRIISGLIVVLLVFDGLTKVMKAAFVIKAAAQLGFSENTVVAIGAVLLVCTALYVIPRTAVLGAILLSAYLGGAVDTMVHARNSPAQMLFPITCGVLVWAGIFFRDARIRALIPLRRSI